MWLIIEKEFYDNLLSQRFAVGILISVILTVGCIVLQTDYYSERVKEYRFDVDTKESVYGSKLESWGWYSLYYFDPMPLIPPGKLSPIANGLPPSTKSSLETISFDRNFLPDLFPAPDIVFVVAIIMSLLAILFSYDSVSGEREQGTLKLIAANSISRPKVLLGKWIGGTTSILIPFLIAIFAGLIYISVSPQIQLGVGDWAAIFLIILASMTYISLFYLLGLMVSAFSRISSAAVLSALALWVLIVLVIPGLGPYLSSRIVPLSSVTTHIQWRSEKHTEESRERLNKIYEEIQQKYESEYGQMFRDYLSMSGEERMSRSGMQAPESRFRTMGLSYRKERRDRRDDYYKAQSEKWEMVEKQVEIDSQKQFEIAKNLASLSPFTNYVFLVSELAGTGVESRDHAANFLSAFNTVHVEYLINKIEKIRSEIIPKEASMTKEDWEMELDISDHPRFEYKERTLKNRLDSVLPYWGILLLFNVLFFAGAFIGFIRYDVR
jgi:ABC-type transport system involved in multi-copper enzyme maturation permease subunit